MNIALRLLVLLGFIPSFAAAQYCAAGPTSTIDSNVESVQLTGASVNINHIGCPGVLNVEDLTTQFADLVAGNTYTISVQFGTCGNNYAGAGQIWIDFDGSLTFDGSETIGSWSGTPPAALSVFTFTVPVNACDGATVMRITQQEGTSLPLNPCATFNWGSTMDFSIIVVGGVPCINSSCQGGPTSTADSNVEQVQLGGISSSINWTGCPGVLGVENSGQMADLYATGSYIASVQFGTCGGNYSGSGEAWIDFDGSGTFDPNESIGTWQGIPPVAASAFSFQVPGGAVNGMTKMRVQQQENGQLPLDPCDVFTWGSVTDFDIEIIGGVNCDFPLLGDMASNPFIVPSIPYVDTGSTAICFSNQSPVYNSPDVFYEFTIPAGMTVVDVSLCSSSFDTYLLITDDQGNTYNFNDDNNDCVSGGGQSAIYQMLVTPGATYQAVVQGWDFASGDYIIEIDEGSTVGIAENHGDQFGVAPNITTGITYLTNGGQGTTVNVNVVDLSGKIVQVVNTNIGKRDQYELNLSHLSKGNYWIRIETAQSIEHHRIVIQ